MLERIYQFIWEYNPCDENAPRSAWRHFLQIMTLTGRDLMGGTITLHAMGLVYTTLLSLVPLLAVSISVLKGFGVHGLLEPTLARVLEPLGERSAEVSSRIVGFVDNMNFGVLGALGLAMLLFTVISLIQKIVAAFNQAWRLHSRRTLVQRFSDYLSVVMVGPLLIFAAVGLTASFGNSHVVAWLNQLPYMNQLLQLGGKLLPFVLVIGAFTFVYLLVPNTRVQLRSALYGAVVAGLSWQVLGMLFASFASGSTNYTAIYSGFAILFMFMIWLYLSWVVLLIGATISFYHQHPEYLIWRKRDIRLSTRMREQISLQAMVDIARAHELEGGEATSLDLLARNQQVPSLALARMLDALEAEGLVLRTASSPPRYLPGSAAHNIRLSEILRCARLAGEEEKPENFKTDGQVATLLDELEGSLEDFLGERTLAEFINQAEDQSAHETGLV
jgi:membrane protein